jgi:hypothetical protein
MEPIKWDQILVSPDVLEFAGMVRGAGEGDCEGEEEDEGVIMEELGLMDLAASATWLQVENADLQARNALLKELGTESADWCLADLRAWVEEHGLGIEAETRELLLEKVWDKLVE